MSIQDFILGYTAGQGQGGSDPVLEPVTVTPSTTQQVITPPEGADGISQATVEAVTKELLAQLDADFIAGNIKQDVDLFGLVGEFEGGGITNGIVFEDAYSESEYYYFTKVKLFGNNISIPASYFAWGSATAIRYGRICTHLEEIEIIGSVKKFSSQALDKSSALRVLKINEITSDFSIANNSFDNTDITDIYVPWAEGAIEGAPWGATNATIHYNWTGGNA